jgi:PAS domain S-box-containing protein
MLEFATGLFDPAGFPPRKACGTGWTPPLVFLHVISDLFIWLAYLSIPLALLYFTRRRDLPFPRLFVLFALFILACGTTHLIDALIFEYPVYRFAGLMKAVTAVVSWATVIALVPIVPRVMQAVSLAAQPGAATREHRALGDADLAPPESRLQAYIAALLAGVLAVLVRAALDPLPMNDHVFVVALLAVVYVSWRYGFGPGVLCACVGVGGYTYFFVAPRHSFQVDGLGNQLAVALFFFCGVACAALGEAQRQAARRARVALATATARSRELEEEVARRLSAEGRLRAFYDNSPVCMGVVEALADDIRHVYDNRASCRFFGVGPEGTGGRRTSELGTPPAVLQLWLGKYRQSGERKAAVHFEYEYRADDGRRWLSATVSPLEASGDGPPLFCYVAEDVTARRRAEEDLRDSEARFRTLAQAVPHIIWVTRPDGYHEYYNDRWYAYTGLTPEESLGHQWSGPLHPDDVARAEARWKQATATGEEYEIEYRFRGADGRYRWFLGRALPQRDADGQIVRWYGTCTDIHDERLAAESVRRSEERFRLLTEAVPHVVWNADTAGEITYLNRRWLEFTAVPLERAGGRGWLDAVHPDDRDRVFAAWRRTVERPADGADRFQHELRLKDAGGGYRWFQTVAVPLRRADGGIDQWIGSMADIHDQKTAAETVRGLNEQLQLRMDELRTVLDAAPAAIWISHDPECRTITGNGTAAELLRTGTADNVSATTADGRGFREVGPDGRPLPPDRLPMQVAVRTGAAVTDADLNLAFDDGRVLHLLGNVVPLRDAAGRVRGAVGVFVDVTERRRSEAALRESEERFRSMADSTPAMVWVAEPDGRRTYFNRTWLEFTGRPAAEQVGAGWADSLHPGDRGRYLAAYTAALAARRPFEIEYRLVRHDGAARWVLARGVPRLDPSGAFAGFVGLCLDVTDRRQAEDRVRESEEQFRQLADSMPQIVFAARPDGTVDYFNHRWYEYTGFPADSPEGEAGWAAVHDPDRLDAVREVWLRAVAAGKPYQIEYRLRRHDGEWRWHLGRALPVRDADGQIVRWYGTNTDIHDAKLAAEALQVSEARFRTLTEAVPQMVWTADPAGEVTFFNRRWDEYTGLPLEAGRKARWADSPLHPDDADRVRAGWQLAVAGGADRHSSEFRLRGAGGEYRWMLSAAVPLRGPDGAVTEWVGSLTDIDDQKRQAHLLERMVRERTAELETANGLLTAEVKDRQAAESQVRAVAAELERSNGELEKFAYVASHDLQEPLRKIQAFGDRLHTKCRDQLPDAGKEYVDRMLSAAVRMRRLIDDLLTFSRVTTQKRPFVRLNLDKLVRGVVSDLDVRIGQAGGVVRVGPLPTLDADPTQMRQLFQNLIANAVKFHTPGVPPVVEIGCEPVELPDAGGPRPGYRISVRDNGIGFDEKYRDRIFNVFQRLHGRDRYEGTGVGLAICRKIAERHGGQITAHSQEGRGAEFVITLPATQNHTREATADDD